MHDTSHQRPVVDKGSFSLRENLGGEPIQGEVTTMQLREIIKRVTWAFMFVELSGWLIVKSSAKEQAGMQFLAPTTLFVPYELVLEELPHINVLFA